MLRKNILLVIITLVICAGCGSNKQNFDYVDSKNGKQLVIRPPLKGNKINHYYDLPNVGKISPQSVNPPESSQAGIK